MSLESMLTLISMWCGNSVDKEAAYTKYMCQSRMTKCIQTELKKNEPKLEPVFLRCWDREMK